jgi:putative ABC transport system permease protein
LTIDHSPLTIKTKAMIKNLLLTALRSLTKNKFFSLLNIAGLAIGMSVFLLIAQYVQFEKSYENFIPGNEDIYRVQLEANDKNELIMATAENYPGFYYGLLEACYRVFIRQLCYPHLNRSLWLGG